jgi:hypothetical protein
MVNYALVLRKTSMHTHIQHTPVSTVIALH